MEDNIIAITPKGVIRDGESVPVSLISSDDKVNEVTDPDYQLKKDVIKELEKAEVTTLSGVANRLGVSKLYLWALKRKDPEFAQQVEEAKEVLADRLEEELLTVDKMPQVVARLARLKTIRLAYRDSFKVVVGSPKVEAYLEEIRRLGKKPDPKLIAEAQSILEQSEINAE